MKLFLNLLVLIALVCPATSGFAENKPKGDKPKKVKTKAEAFKGRDKNQDEKVTREEFLDGKKNQKKAERHFMKLDKDKDNSLTLEEFRDGKE